MIDKSTLRNYVSANALAKAQSWITKDPGIVEILQRSATPSNPSVSNCCVPPALISWWIS